MKSRSYKAVLAICLLAVTSLPAAGDDPAVTTGSLGISGMECKCSLIIRGEDLRDWAWTFRSEPKITEVDPDGPGAGILRPGDVIVAVDDLLIMTHAGGKRFASFQPGEAVELTLRRDGRLVRETVIAAEGEDSSSLFVESEEGASLALEIQMAELAEKLSRLDIEDFKLTDLENMSLVPPGSVSDSPSLDFRPLAWLGLSLSFSGSLNRRDPGGPGRWDFDDPPRVNEVSPDGPADRAGIREGDLLTHIDGVRLDTRAGGRRFSRIEPGQTVTWTVKRDVRTFEFTMTAEKRPDR